MPVVLHRWKHQSGDVSRLWVTERCIVHHQYRFILWPSSTVLEKLGYEVPKYNSIRGAAENRPENDLILGTYKQYLISWSEWNCVTCKGILPSSAQPVALNSAHLSHPDSSPYTRWYNWKPRQTMQVIDWEIRILLSCALPGGLCRPTFGNKGSSNTRGGDNSLELIPEKDSHLIEV